jgi:hypothetical protein
VTNFAHYLFFGDKFQNDSEAGCASFFRWKGKWGISSLVGTLETANLKPWTANKIKMMYI